MSEAFEVFHLRMPINLDGLDRETADLAKRLYACQQAARQDGREWVVQFTEWGPFSVQWRGNWAQRMHPEFVLANSGGRERDAALRALMRAGDVWGWIDEPSQATP